MLKCFHLLPTPFRHLAIWIDESSEARIWRHHRPELVEYVDRGMVCKEGRYSVPQMLKYTEIAGMKIIAYHNRGRSEAFHIPEDAF